ncbi:MAG: DUF3168 domain-containing protein [Limimaricola soesokkakensis]|uniref:DUF3168 domain-containing protein n=1 Tax=Limimaricola soesokkakensis TaxID=1343159 RepID=UPI004059806D
MERQLRALLEADPAIAAITAHINWGAHPTGLPWPAAVLTVISDTQGYTLDGPDGLSAIRVQIDCYAATYDAAKDLSRAIRAKLSGYSGGQFQGVFLAGLRDGREGGTNEADRPFRVSMDFMVHFTH